MAGGVPPDTAEGAEAVHVATRTQVTRMSVGETQVVRVAIEHPQRLADGLGARRVEAHSRQRHFEQFEQVRFVIDDQHFGLTTGFARHWMCFSKIQTDSSRSRPASARA